MAEHRTHLTTLHPDARKTAAVSRVPCIVLRDSTDPFVERVAQLDPTGARAVVVGRAADCHIRLDDGAVSRRHVSIRLAEPRRLEATDLDSTNGSYLDGVRFSGATHVAPGQTLQIGRHLISLDWRDPARAEAAADLARDLERASHYVESLLPRRVTDGPVQLDWAFEPSAKLGGDVFGYHAIDSQTLAGYLIDVTGHGVGAAMHSTSILATLRRQALSNTDFRDPARVLTRLNDTFSMDEHDGFCFTIWYGVYDVASRTLRYGSGGHHPAYLVHPLDGALTPLRNRDPMMGVMPGHQFASGQVAVPRGGRLHVFSDGCFEIVAANGAQWGMADFLPLLTGTPEGVQVRAETIHRAVRAAARPGPLADDLSLLSVTFS